MEAIERKLLLIPENASPEQTAAVLFPDEGTRAEYVRLIATLEKVYEGAKAEAEIIGETTSRALPVVIAVALPIIARCIAGALTSAAIGELIHLAHTGR